jgi:pSer/pThr/pTyr-binding forkhead associated (FHA) protein
VIQLDILSGKKAGTSIVARRFPFRVGRSSDSALLLDDGGVWDRHLTFNSHRGSAVVLNVQQDALATVNGAPMQTASLKNGDVIEFGAVKLRFSLSAARQRSQRWREIALWVGLGLVFAGQIAIIYLLME